MTPKRVRVIQQSSGGCPQRFWNAYNATRVLIDRADYPKTLLDWAIWLADKRATPVRGTLIAAVNARVLTRDDAERVYRSLWLVASQRGSRWAVERLFDGIRQDKVFVELARVVPEELAAGGFGRAA